MHISHAIATYILLLLLFKMNLIRGVKMKSCMKGESYAGQNVRKTYNPNS